MMDTKLRNDSEKKLQEICLALEKADWTGNYSLLAGKSGYLIFLRNLGIYNKMNYEHELSQVCEAIFEDVQQSTPLVSYCQGLAGLLIPLDALELQDTVDDELLDMLAKNALNSASQGNFDFLHGSTGIVFALSRFRYKSSAFFDQWVSLLQSRIESYPGGIRMKLYYPGHPFSENDVQYNYSISHGLAAVVIVLMELLNENQIQESNRPLIKDFITSLLKLRNPGGIETGEGLYPSIITETGRSHYFFRVSWCYGDLGVALMLNRYAKFSGDDSFNPQMFEILDYYSRAVDPETWEIRDADFCHGAAGLAILFHYFRKETGKPLYGETALHWYRRMLRMDSVPGGLAGYEHYDPDGNYNSPGLLEGVTGIGLTILTFLQDEKPHWASSLLIA